MARAGGHPASQFGGRYAYRSILSRTASVAGRQCRNRRNPDFARSANVEGSRELVGEITIYRRRSALHRQADPAAPDFAAQAVIAIENTRLFSELRKSLQQQTATADVLKVISRSTFDLQVVLDTLVKSAVRLCEDERGLVFRREGETYKSVAYYNYSPEFRAFHESHPITQAAGQPSAALRWKAKRFKLSISLPTRSIRSAKRKSSAEVGLRLQCPCYGKGLLLERLCFNVPSRGHTPRSRSSL